MGQALKHTREDAVRKWKGGASIVSGDLTYCGQRERVFLLEEQSTKVRCVRYQGYDQIRVTAGHRAVYSL